MKRIGEPAGHLPRKKFLLGGLLLLAGVAAAVIGAVIYFGRTRPPEKGPPSAEEVAARGQHLYTVNCAQCHGEKGDGKGPAARFLYPRPRNFGEGKFRLTTTDNPIPSDDDLFRVISKGMPGSAMVPFGHLSEGDRRALVVHVRRLIRSGIEEALRQLEGGGPADPAELEERTRPGEPLPLPGEWAAVTPESVHRGQDTYRRAGCIACHGETGKGDGAQEQKDDDGTPTRPRDFTRGIFKSGRDPRLLYARVLRGMPGTPMPATSGVRPDDITDLINYVLSLSSPDAQNRVEHRRTQLVARRVATPLGETIPDEIWEAVAAVPIVVSPLWWRDYPEPALQVRALHDGKTLALRLEWQDETVNDAPVRPEDFEDMAAVQLFHGKEEPFLGMGAADSRIDLWLWRASWHSAAARSESILDDYPFDTPVYRGLTKGGDKGIPDFLTARAAGNPNTNADRSRSASSLAAAGFGSTTFRPKASQLVTASSARQDGRWVVVLRRPLSVGADDGVALAAGESYSIAFAIWDGAARDRNGQKLVSIWHDLKLE